MADKNKETDCRLRLVHSQTDEDIKRKILWEKLAVREFNCGTFEEVLKRRKHLTEDCLEVEGESDQQKIEKLAKEAIINVLFRETGLKRSRLPIGELVALETKISVNVGLTDFMRNTSAPDLPMKNVKKHFTSFIEIIRKALDRCITREELEHLVGKDDVIIRNSDLTRLLIYDINQNRECPLIIVMPNEYKPYNPFLMLLKGEELLPEKVLRLLHLIDQ